MTDSYGTVVSAIEAAPDLAMYGYRCGHMAAGAGRCLNAMCGKPDDFAGDRARLLGANSLAVIEAAMGVLRTCRPTVRAGGRAPSSYGLKHALEERLTDHPAARGYVANGQAIAAALALGFPVGRYELASPNAGIGVHLVDYERLRAK
jgi:hypothetical protein